MSTCEYARDCGKVPIPSKCVKYCLERILRNLNIEEKQLILGLDENLAKAIFDTYNKYDINSFLDLETRLTNEQVNTLLDKFNLINQFQLSYFNKSINERTGIRDLIKNLNLEHNTDDDDLLIPAET